MRSFSTYKKQIEIAYLEKGSNLPLITMLSRLIVWMIRYRSFSDFFSLGLNKQGTSLRQILSHKEFLRIHNRLNPLRYLSILEDKYVFDRFFNGYGFPLAEMLGYIANDEVHWLNDKKVVALSKLPDYNMDCFLKSFTKWGGQAVHKLSVVNKELFVDNCPTSLEDLKKIIKNDLFVMQKTVYQHPVINKLSKSSVNTIRMLTIHNGREAENFYSYLRMGIGDSLVDNISHGGLGCGIHSDGTLYENAISDKGFYVQIKNHPTTGTLFGEIQIPFFREASELVISMHNTLHCFFIVGWDVAITESGPVIIEGNPVGDLIFEQKIFGGFREKFLEFAVRYESQRDYLL